MVVDSPLPYSLKKPQARVGIFELSESVCKVGFRGCLVSYVSSVIVTSRVFSGVVFRLSFGYRATYEMGTNRILLGKTAPLGGLKLKFDDMWQKRSHLVAWAADRQGEYH